MGRLEPQCHSSGMEPAVINCRGFNPYVNRQDSGRSEFTKAELTQLPPYRSGNLFDVLLARLSADFQGCARVLFRHLRPP